MLWDAIQTVSGYLKHPCCSVMYMPLEGITSAPSNSDAVWFSFYTEGRIALEPLDGSAYCFVGSVWFSQCHFLVMGAVSAIVALKLLRSVNKPPSHSS